MSAPKLWPPRTMNTVQGFVRKHAAWAANVYADDARAYETLPFGHEVHQARRPHRKYRVPSANEPTGVPNNSLGPRLTATFRGSVDVPASAIWTPPTKCMLSGSRCMEGICGALGRICSPLPQAKS